MAPSGVSAYSTRGGTTGVDGARDEPVALELAQGDREHALRDPVDLAPQFGAAVGLAVVAAVNVAATGDGSPEALLDGYRTALLVPVIATALGLAVTATGLARVRRPLAAAT